MAKLTPLPLIVIPLVLAACGQAQPVNPPTEPAAPIVSAEPEAATPGLRPGTGAQSFVGRWAADVSWCADPSGDRRPVEITTTTFEGYENSCIIASIDETAQGYDAALRCVSEGATSDERVRMVVTGEVLTLTYLDREGAPVALSKCTTLGDTAPPVG